ncbi:MAG: uracil permease [Firmicutes bacterium]|nr:uracil permease [Bacillota bacterium]
MRDSETKTAVQEVAAAAATLSATGIVTTESDIGLKKELILAVQHTIAMFGATVLVPFLTGLSPTVALFTAGLGTLIFHLITKGMVPVFLGSSFAFIAPILAVKENFGLPYATGGIMVAGLVYVAMSLVIKLLGVERVRSFFPPTVTGPVIMVIGLTLAPVAIDMAKENWVVAIIVLISVILSSVFMKGFFKMVPILIGVVVGYLASMLLGIVDFEAIKNAAVFAVPDFMAPKFSWGAIAIVAPVALVTMMEHIGDIMTNGAVVKKDFLVKPGLHRTMLGDGLATMAAALLGGPANTTYSENTGVLALTKVYDPKILRYAAIFAIALSFVGKLGAIIQTIPTPVMGGICILLFGMIASIGMRTVAERVDFSHSRNLIISAVILVFGLSGVEILGLSGMSLAAVLGVILNKLLPEEV